MSISQNFPAIRPTLNLNFARSKTLDPRITFTRSSTATYIDSDGLVKTAGVNQARFDHDPVTGESLGLLIEESRTNLITYNTAIGGTGWVVASYSNSFVTQNYAIAPDGTQTASRVYKDALDGGDINLIYTQGSFSTVASQRYAISAFVKVLSGPTTVNLEWDPNNFGGGRSRVYFDLDNLITTETHTNPNPGSSIDGRGIEVFPNGWYRVYFYVTVQSSGGLGSNGAVIMLNRYTRDTSDTLWWGVQAENATFHTSFIKTEANHVTRSADSALISPEGWWDYSKGTVYAEFRGGLESQQNGYGRIWSPDGAAALSAQQAHVSNNGYTIWFGGSAPKIFSQDHLNSFGKIAVSYSNNGTSADIVMGSYPVTTTGTTNQLTSTTTSHGIGRNANATTNMLNGHIKKLAYYPEVLTSSQLQNLTK